jgi:HAD superfamily hydrolase (TIGR01549 family)
MVGGRWHGRESIGSEEMDAVVFDWDGTLVDTLPTIFQANIAVLDAYGVQFDEARYRASYAPDWRVMYRRLGVPEEHLEAAGASWLALYRASKVPSAFEGVPDALRRLADAGYVMGLVTAGHRALVEEQLDGLGLSAILPIRVCGDDAVPAKPHPEPLRRVLEGLGVGDRPDRAIYVGDAPDDMRMACSVGALAVGIVSVLGTAGDLVAAGADEVSDSMVGWVDGFLDQVSRGPR